MTDAMTPATGGTAGLMTDATQFGLTWARTFPGVLDQASQARRFLAGILDGSPLADDALACLSELVGNALTHSDSRLPGGEFTVTVNLTLDRLAVSVADQGGRWAPDESWDAPAGENGPDVLRVSGRGLIQIVDSLADRWGIEPQADSTARLAWFELEPR